jgi:hypothetical protein
MRRVAAASDGGEFLFPQWLPVCTVCHSELESGQTGALEEKLQKTTPGRRVRQVRQILPLFLEARDGLPLARSEAPQLVRQAPKGKRA